MAHAGKIHHDNTFIEITEDGKIWLIQNYFDDDTILLELEKSNNGDIIEEDGEYILEEIDDFYGTSTQEDKKWTLC